MKEFQCFRVYFLCTGPVVQLSIRSFTRSTTGLYQRTNQRRVSTQQDRRMNLSRPHYLLAWDRACFSAEHMFELHDSRRFTCHCYQKLTWRSTLGGHCVPPFLWDDDVRERIHWLLYQFARVRHQAMLSVLLNSRCLMSASVFERLISSRFMVLFSPHLSIQSPSTKSPSYFTCRRQHPHIGQP